MVEDKLFCSCYNDGTLYVRAQHRAFNTLLTFLFRSQDDKNAVTTTVSWTTSYFSRTLSL